MKAPHLSWLEVWHLILYTPTWSVRINLRRLMTKPALWSSSEDTDQPGHPPSLIPNLIWVFAVRSKGSWGPNLSLCGQRRLIRLGTCPGWSEFSLTAKVILLVLSWGGSFVLFYFNANLVFQPFLRYSTWCSMINWRIHPWKLQESPFV